MKATLTHPTHPHRFSNALGITVKLSGVTSFDHARVILGTGNVTGAVIAYMFVKSLE